MKKEAGDNLKKSLNEVQDKVASDAEKKVGVQLENLQEQVREQKEELGNAKDKELEFLKKEREFERQKENFPLEFERALVVERKKIVKEVSEHMDEASRLKDEEMKQENAVLKKRVDDLRVRLEQGSQQLQGEAQEVVLEEDLRIAFIHDDIREVPKGIRGADCIQDVKTPAGILCGSILWESKSTKGWSKKWAAKLKEDQREAKADIAVIMSRVLPDGVRHFGQHESVWVCDFASCIGLATALRISLVDLERTRTANTGKDEKMEALYGYLTGMEFRQAVEGIVESFDTMKTDLAKEKRAMERIWAKREKEIEATLKNTARMYGSLQGIAGINSLPEIKRLELPEG